MPEVWRFTRSASRGAVLPVVVALLVVTVLAGCTSGTGTGTADPRPTSTYTASVPVLQPGRPGEPATSLAPGETAQRSPESAWNGADAYFVSAMVLHHLQALRMARLADGRTTDPQVLAVAERVSAAQAPEVLALKAWLSARDQKIPNSQATDGSAHAGHAEMPGAVTPARMEALARTSGPEFDRLFLDLMIAHHTGAVQMAEEVTTAGADLIVQETAAEVSVSQSAEIRRMQEVLAAL